MAQSARTQQIVVKARTYPRPACFVRALTTKTAATTLITAMSTAPPILPPMLQSTSNRNQQMNCETRAGTKSRATNDIAYIAIEDSEESEKASVVVMSAEPIPESVVDGRSSTLSVVVVLG